MESMLFYGKETLIPNLSPITSIVSSHKKSKLHFSVNHISPNSWIRSKQILYPVIRASNELVPSRNGKNNNNKIARGKWGASIALACIVGIFGINMKMNSKAIAGPKELYQKAPQVVVAYPLGGRSALKSLLDINVYLSSSKLEPPGALSRLPLSSRPSAEEVNEIKMEAVLLMRYGKPDDAVLLLRNAYDFYRYDPEPAYYLEMALVEILICQGKYMEALECECLQESHRLLSDGRFPLYKAITFTMLGEQEEAKRWWSEYMETVEEEFDPRTSF